MIWAPLGAPWSVLALGSLVVLLPPTLNLAYCRHWFIFTGFEYEQEWWALILFVALAISLHCSWKYWCITDVGSYPLVSSHSHLPPPKDVVCLTWAVTEVACNDDSVSEWITASSGSHWLTVICTAAPVTCDAFKCFFFFLSNWKWMCPRRHLLALFKGRWWVDEQNICINKKHKQNKYKTHWWS